MIFFREYRTLFHQHSPDNVTGAKNRPQTRINTGLAGDFSSLVCTTFAWFTSKDEVTNRLSANADYGVSIVESFAPPENWLPGQEVNKDVYAVNTGNVGAFVEESVSGTLTITQEVATPSLTADSIELTKAERYVKEAGAFLAYKPANSNAELGKQVVSMVPDATNLDAYEAVNTPLTDFAPDAPGLYVFRRTVGVDPETGVEQYTYDGYYYATDLAATTKQQQVVGTAEDGEEYVGRYKWTGSDNQTYWSDSAEVAPVAAGVTMTAVMEEVPDSEGMPGKFYKISNLKVTPAAVTLAGDTDQTDGYLEGAEAGFYEERTTVAKPVDLQYDADGNQLVATFNTNGEVDFEALKDLAKDYDDALIAYQDAIEEYKAAVRDNAGSNAELAAKYKALQEALDAWQAAKNAEALALKNLQNANKVLGDAEAAKEAAQQAKDDADAAVTAAQGVLSNAQEADDAAQAAVDQQIEVIYGSTTGDEDHYTPGSKYGLYKAAETALNATQSDDREAFEALFEAYVDDNDIVDGDDNPVTLETVTYEQLLDMDLDLNEGDGRYDYYEKFVEFKEAEKNLNDAKETLAQKEAAKRATAAALAAAQAAFEAAQAAFEAAQAAQAEADQNLQDATDAYNNASGAVNDPDEGLAAAYAAAQAETAAKKALVDSARTAYEAAAEAAGQDTEDLNAAKAKLTAATQALAEAQAAYENAAPNEENDGVLKINIKLSDDVTTVGGTADKWQLLPDYIGEDKTAYFYYTGILEGGETSTKLIDSVELDSSVTEDMFKYFDFDLNVALKSAQITYDADGKITADAATELDATPTVATPASLDTALTWAPTAP